MIYSTFDAFDRTESYYAEPIRKAVLFLKNSDFRALRPGIYPIQGNQVYMQVFHTVGKPAEEVLPEAHDHFVDIYYTAEGEEWIGVCTRSKAGEEQVFTERYDSVCFHRLEEESKIIMKKGTFLVCFPWDVHRPGCAVGQPQPVIRGVIKIQLSLLHR